MKYADCEGMTSTSIGKNKTAGLDRLKGITNVRPEMLNNYSPLVLKMQR